MDVEEMQVREKCGSWRVRMEGDAPGTMRNRFAGVTPKPLQLYSDDEEDHRTYPT
jgi:hypothetical protein